MQITKEIISETITKLSSALDDELYGKEEQALEEYWHFEWDDEESLVHNTYNFHDLLKLYGSFCRRWEVRHNGSCCVVERVRDKYLIPKIQDFTISFEAHLKGPA
jgi:hypothetical protein